MFGGQYKNRRVLITGHTGFKGSWLALWLTQLGAEVMGIALDPDVPSAHWDLLDLGIDERRFDICNADAVRSSVQEMAPEIVFHLAAQPLVRRSYREPLVTWSTNVMGTANLLEACRQQQTVRAIVAVTTDKCYQNKEWLWGYRENDRLGGHDPYSASKAAAELVIASYRAAFFDQEKKTLLASARAGNVIGGGDWCEDRLIPDVMRSVSSKETLVIRSPNATRPWQHVLESLSGYLSLGQKLLESDDSFAEAWNFGPGSEGNCTVGEVLSQLKHGLPALDWEVTAKPQPHEANLLQLDSTKAQTRLGWHPVWSLAEGLAATAAWYRAFIEENAVISREQLEAYITAAKRAEIPWSQVA